MKSGVLCSYYNELVQDVHKVYTYVCITSGVGSAKVDWRKVSFSVWMFGLNVQKIKHSYLKRTKFGILWKNVRLLICLVNEGHHAICYSFKCLVISPVVSTTLQRIVSSFKIWNRVPAMIMTRVAESKVSLSPVSQVSWRWKLVVDGIDMKW